MFLLHANSNKLSCIPGCSDGELRLVGSGSTQLQGRVEMCYSGVWGTVCDDQWGRADAAVVCRQLGFSSSGTHENYGSYISLFTQYFFKGAIARTSGTYGQGTGPILLDEVRCTGLEYRLFDCVSNGIEVEDCSHTEDAGVVCLAGMIHFWRFH